MKTARQQRRRQAHQARKRAQRQVAPSVGYTPQDGRAAGVLALLVVGCFLPSILWGGFVWDDNVYLVGVEPISTWSGLWQIWGSPATLGDYYWPLTYTTFWAEHKLWGFNPTGYRAVNVLLHLANTLLVWHLMRRLAVPGAWAVAAFFAIHPLHVESVAWIIERKDMLSGFFFLAAALLWMRFAEKARSQYWAGSLLLYVAALLSKSIAVTLPAALLLWHWWKKKPPDWIRLGAFFVVGLALVLADVVRHHAIKALSFDFSLIERALIAARALWFYAGKLLWPTNLSVVYPRWDVQVADPLAWGYLIAAIAFSTVLWHLRQRIGRGPLVGVLFFVVVLSPVLGFVDYGYMRYSFVADRFVYLAGIGVMAVVCGGATWGVRRLSDLWQKGAWAVAVAVIVVLGMLTWKHAGIWKDDETLWRHVIKLNPQAYNAHANLGNALRKQKRYEEAVAEYQKAIKQDPHNVKTFVYMGRSLNRLDRFEEAEKFLRVALAVSPPTLRTQLHLGHALYGQQRYEEAVAAYQAAIEQAPDLSEPRISLGMALGKLGRHPQAETHLRRALVLIPQNVDALEHLANALMAQEKYGEVLQCLDQLLAIDPTHEAARQNRAVVLEAMQLQKGQADE